MSRMFSFGICFVLVCALAQSASAQVELKRSNTPRNGMPAGGAGFTKAQLIAKFDKNRNGQLDESELATWRNSLSPAEAAAAGVRMPGSGTHKPELIRRFDTNGDGTLSKEEKRQYREAPVVAPRVDDWTEGNYLPPEPVVKRRTGPVIPRPNANKPKNMYQQ